MIEGEIGKMVSHVVAEANKNYGQWVDREDMRQQVVAYALSNEVRFEKWLGDGEKFRVFRALFGAAKQYGETEKAEQSGYKFSDLAWYTPSKLADLVPFALNSEWDGLTGESSEDSQPTRGNAFEGGNLLAMVCDIRRVTARNTGWKLKDFDPATDWGMSNLQWLSKQLGGSFPSAPGYRRRAKTNREAIQETVT